jgi:nicotinamidase-related amidase
MIKLYEAIMRILLEQSAAVLIDMQDRLFPHMHDKDLLLNNSLKLIDGFKILDVPILVTQQYSAGLGPTISPIIEKFTEFKYIEKNCFSCCDEPAFIEYMSQLKRHFILLFGIESHVCILQTCIDLLEIGIIPVVVEDCISSRSVTDKNIAIERMRQEGARITSCESILLELTRKAGSERFKNISKIIK